MDPWWKRFPGVHEEEVAALDELGIAYERDDDAWADGVLQFRLHPEVDGREIELVATYPDLYPYFRFQVRAPSERQLVRHREPFGGVLCLVGRGGENWEVDDRLAWFIQHQLPKVLRLGAEGADEKELEDGEEHQGEPFSEYYPYVDEALLVVDSSWETMDAGPEGSLTLSLEARDDGVVRGVVSELRTAEGKSLGSFPGTAAIFPTTLLARWFRMPEAIPEEDAERAFSLLASAHGSARQSRATRLGPFTIEVFGVVFPEEVAWRRHADGWIFIVRVQPAKQPKQRRLPPQFYFARAGRGGPEDLGQRIPLLRALKDKTVAVMGLGGLGAPSALEFGKAQVGHLRLCDQDLVEPGAAVRWPLGVAAAGVSKARLASFIQQQWPFVKVEGFRHRLGDFPRGPNDARDLEFVDSFLGGADLVYDASADVGVQYFLSQQARERGIAYVAVDATVGGWGGKIVRVAPETTKGCWLCSRAMFDKEDMKLPPADPDGDIQATGCADVTFTGSSFELMPLVAEGLRLAVGALCSADGDAYPNPAWDVGVLHLRSESGEVIPPRWDVRLLDVHSDCPVCGG